MIVHDGCLKELNQVLMFDVIRSVTWQLRTVSNTYMKRLTQEHVELTYLECAVTSRMLREFVRPEFPVRGTLIDPVSIHPVKEIIAFEVFDECRYGCTIVCWNHCAVGQTIRSVGTSACQQLLPQLRVQTDLGTGSYCRLRSQYCV